MYLYREGLVEKISIHQYGSPLRRTYSNKAPTIYLEVRWCCLFSCLTTRDFDIEVMQSLNVFRCSEVIHRRLKMT